LLGLRLRRRLLLARRCLLGRLCGTIPARRFGLRLGRGLLGLRLDSRLLDQWRGLLGRPCGPVAARLLRLGRRRLGLAWQFGLGLGRRDDGLLGRRRLLLPGGTLRPLRPPTLGTTTLDALGTLWAFGWLPPLFGRRPLGRLRIGLDLLQHLVCPGRALLADSFLLGLPLRGCLLVGSVDLGSACLRLLTLLVDQRSLLGPELFDLDLHAIALLRLLAIAITAEFLPL